LLPDYQILVFSPTTGAPLALYDGVSLYNLTYSRVLNGIGAVTLELPSDDTVSANFPLDALIEVQRTSPITGMLQVEGGYFARLTHRYRQGDEERFLVGGVSYEHLLTRRVIDPADDPTAAGGYSTKAGPADQIMVSYAREQAADLASATRSFPNFTVAASLDVGIGAGKRLRYDSLFKVFQDLAEAGNVDFQIVRINDNNLRLIVAPIGIDRTQTRNYPFAPFVRLDPARGNLEDPSLLLDRREEQNYVYALGQGANENRILAELSGLGIGDSPYNRIEFKIDVRRALRNEINTLLTSARSELADKRAVKEFTFKPSGTEPGNIYRQDWDIGDKITAAWDNVEIDLRVIEVELRVDSSGEDINVKLEEQYE